MSPIGIFLLVWLIYLFFKKKLVQIIIYLFDTTLFFELFANSGVLFSGVKYADLLWTLLFICCNILLIRRQLIPKENRWLMLLALGMLFAIFVEIINPFELTGFNSRSIFVACKYIFVIFVLNTAMGIFNHKNYEDIINVLFKFQQIIYVIAIFEFVYENILGFGNYGDLLEGLFGTGEHQVMWNDIRVGFSSIQGLCKEPSHLAICLFFCNLFNIISQMKYGRGFKYFLLNCFLLLISGSLSSILYILGSVVMWAKFLPLKKVIPYLIGLVVVMAAFAIYYGDIVAYYIGRITNIMEFNRYGIENTTSEGHRLGGVGWSWEMFKEHPIWGIGLGNNVQTGASFSLLSSMGLLCFLIYLKNIIKMQEILFPFLIVFIAGIFAMDGGVYYSSHFCFFIMYYCYYFNLSSKLLETKCKDSKINVKCLPTRLYWQ